MQRDPETLSDNCDLPRRHPERSEGSLTSSRITPSNLCAPRFDCEIPRSARDDRIFHRGLLLNFGAPSLEHRRLVFGLSDNLRKSVQSVDDTSSQSVAEIYL